MTFKNSWPTKFHNFSNFEVQSHILMTKIFLPQFWVHSLLCLWLGHNWKMGESGVLSHRHPQKCTHNEQYEHTPERKLSGIFPSIFHVYYTWYRNPLWSEVKVAQLCLTLCGPMDCNLPRPLCPWNSPGKNAGVGSCFLLQRIFPIQGLKPGLPHCEQILYCLNHREVQKYSLPSNKQQGQNSAYKSVMSFIIHLALTLSFKITSIFGKYVVDW